MGLNYVLFRVWFLFQKKTGLLIKRFPANPPFINAITLIPLPTTRTPNIINSTTTGTIPTSYGFSVANVGAGAGTVNLQSIPAGVTVNFDPGVNNTITGLPYNATGTTFLITYLS